MKVNERLLQLTHIKSLIFGISAAATWILSTAKLWLNSESSSAEYWLIRYISDRFWPELVILAFAITALAIPRSFYQKFSQKWHSYAERMISNTKIAIHRKNWVFLFMAALSHIFVALGVVFLLLALYDGAKQVVYDRAALLIKYSEADMLRYIGGKSREEIERLHFARARSIYETALRIYGKDERTAEIRRELAKLNRFKEFGLVLFERALAIEKVNGPNRISLYLYIEAMPLIPDSAEPIAKLETYSDVLEQVIDRNRKILYSCQQSDSEGLLLGVEEFNQINGFFNSRLSRELLDPGNNKIQLEQKILKLCNHVRAFGPPLHSMTDEHSELVQLLANFKEVREFGLHEDAFVGAIKELELERSE